MLRTMVTSLVLVLGACSVGQVDGITPATDGGGGQDGTGGTVDKTSYMQQVLPLVSRCTGCHGTQQDPNLQSYDLLKPIYKQKPASANVLINEDIITNTPGQHQGIAYLNTTEKQAVSTWIDGQTGM